MNTFNNSNEKEEKEAVYSQRQLEWATRNPVKNVSSEEFTPEEIPADLESLEQAWQHFGTLLDTASDDDFRPAEETTCASAPHQRVSKTRIFPAIYALCSLLFALVCVALVYHQFSSADKENVSKPLVAVNPVSTDATNVPLESETNIVSEETLAWTEDSEYDTDLASLSDSILNASSSGTWELSALADYNAMETALEEDVNSLF